MEISSSSQRKNHERGFSLIECILAVAVLSVVMGSLVVLQSSIAYLSVYSLNETKSVWAFQQALAQADYVLDRGLFVEYLPKDASFVWPTAGTGSYTVHVLKIPKKEIKPSQFLASAFRASVMLGAGGNRHADVDNILAPIANIIDNQLPETDQDGNFVNVSFDVSWPWDGGVRSLRDDLFFINHKAFAALQLGGLGVDKNDSATGNQGASSSATANSGSGT